MKLFIFGSTGDLVKRKVMKALHEIYNSEENLEIYAIGRKDLDRKEYQNFICSDWCVPKFRDSLHYIQVNFDKLDLSKYLSDSDTNYFYVSLPPSEYKKIFRFTEEIVNKNYDIKILAEKPFGLNLDNAQDLKNFIENSSLKNKIFISDHYLFKKNFMKLSEIRNFRKLKIVSVEEVGLEGRVSYYDSVGAIKDMVQSHFLNLVKKNLNFEVNPDEIKVTEFVRGQYEGYSDELGKKSKTETFVYVSFKCCGKEFEFITGKAFEEKEGYVEVDGEKFEIGEDNSYVEIFRRFLSGDENLMIGFPTIEDSVLGWEIVEKFEEYGKDKELIFYEKGSELRDVLAQKNS